LKHSVYYKSRSLIGRQTAEYLTNTEYRIQQVRYYRATHRIVPIYRTEK